MTGTGILLVITLFTIIMWMGLGIRAAIKVPQSNISWASLVILNIWTATLAIMTYISAS